MKRRIFSFLMALCMVISLLPVSAFAAAPTITVTMNGLAWTDVTEGEHKYATTDATTGIATECDATANWNIHLDYTAGQTPTLYLKSATLKATVNAEGNGVAALNVATSGAFVLNSVEGTTNTLISDIDAKYTARPITLSAVKGTTITGKGKLIGSSTGTGNAAAVIGTAYNLTLKNADVALTVEKASYQPCIVMAGSADTEAHMPGQFVIDGGNVVFTNNATGRAVAYMINSWAQGAGDNVISTLTSKKVTIKGGANVEIFASGTSAVIGAAGGVDITNSTLEITKTNFKGYGEVKTFPVINGTHLVEYKNHNENVTRSFLTTDTADEDYIAAGTDMKTGDYETPNIEHIKISHVCGTDKGDCTASGTCKDCGAEVEAKEHSYTDLADTTCNNAGCAFTRFASLYATISGVNMDTAYGDTKYATMDATGAVALVGAGDAWNIKIDYTGDVPVLSLQNITATGASFNLHGAGALQIDVLTDVTITSNNVFTFAMEGGTTITSPTNGKLTVEMSSTSGQKLLTAPVGTLTFQNANVSFYAIRSSSYTIGEYAGVDVAGDVIISGGTAVLNGGGSNIALKVGGNLTVEKGANVTLLSSGWACVADVTGNILVKSANLSARHDWGNPSAIKWLFNKMPSMTDDVSGVYSTSASNYALPNYQKKLTAETDILDWENNKIYYIAFTHTCRVDDCTAGGICGCGKTVEAQANHVFADLDAINCSVCRFTRPDSLHATISGVNMDTVYGETKYATMDATGAVALVGANDAWNIKIDFTDDVPVLSLQNITATPPANTFDMSGKGALVIKNLTDVTLKVNGANNAFVLSMEGGTTFTSEGASTLFLDYNGSTAMEHNIKVLVGNLTFENANLDIKSGRSSSYTPCATINAVADVTFIGGNYTIDGSGGSNAIDVGGNLVVKNGANVTLLSSGHGYVANVAGDILVKSADLVAKHTWGVPSATKWLFNKVPTAAEDVKAVYSTDRWNYTDPAKQKALTAETDILDWENNPVYYIALTHTCLVKDCAVGLTCDCGKVTAPAEHTIVGNDGDCTTAEMCEVCGMIFKAAADAHSFTNKASDKVASAATATAPEYCYVQCDNCDAVSDTLKVAAGKTPVTVAMTGLVWENIEVGTHKYATTDATTGVATECDANADWNIHLDYSGNTPVLYLKGATLNATLDADGKTGVPALSVTTGGAFVLNSVAGTTNTLTSAVTSYLATAMTLSATLGTTVTGTGNLVGNVSATGNSAPAISTKYDLTFKDANVNLTVAGAYRPCIGMAGSGDTEGNLPGLLVIDGGNMVLTNLANGRCIAYMQNTWGQGTSNNSTLTSKTVTIKGGANVQLNGKGNANVIGAAGGVIVELSTLEIILNAGTGQSGWIGAELTKFPQTNGTHMVEYKVASDWDTAKSFLSTNTADADYIAPGTDMTAVDSYLHYLKIYHVHNVEGGCTAGGACVDCGAEVEAKAHSYADFDATVCSDCGTVRPAGLYATISGVEMNTSYGETKYATMDANGAVALVDENAAWNIKIDYTDDVPVLSLQNITAVAPANTFVMNGEGALVIKNLTDVSITANGACNAFVLGMEGGTTFTSEGESKLTIPFSNNTGMMYVIDAKAGSLTFENANIDIDSGRSASYETKFPAVNAVADVTFIGGTAKIMGGGGNNAIEVGGDLVVSSGANVTLLSSGWGYVANVAGDILVKSANLYARHSWGSPTATKWLFNKMPVMADDVSGVYSTSSSNYALPNYQKKLTAETDIWDWENENNRVYYIAITHTCIVDDCTVGGICDCGKTVEPQANHVFADIDATNCSVCRFTRLPGLHATISGVNMDTADGEIKYATMDATGAVALVDEKAAWNIKIDFTEDVPVLSLQNITTTGGTFNLSGKGALQIDVLTDVTITSNNVFTLKMEGGTTITSPTNGKLTVAMSSTSGQKLLSVPVGTLTFKNANVDFNAIRSSSYTTGEYAGVDVAGDVIFSGGTAVIEGSGSNIGLKVGGDLIVEKNANVTLRSGGYGAAADVTGEIKVINANLIGRHNWGTPSADKWLINKIPAELVGVDAVYSDHQWNWSDPAYQKALDGKDDAFLVDPANTIYYIAITHSCVVEDCLAGGTCGCGNEVAAKAHVFDSDCTTADKCANCAVVAEANAAHSFDGDKTTADTCQNQNCTVVDEVTTTAVVRIFNEGGASYWMKTAKPGQVYYATNDADGVVTATTAEAGDWTIKFEYPVGGIPTLTFKGAKIQGNSTGHGMYFGQTDNGFKIVVEEDSEVNNGTHTCFWATGITGDVIIEGPGKLTLNSTNGTPMQLSNVGDAYIQDVKLEIISTANNTRSGILKGRGNLIVDNSEIDFSIAMGSAIWMYEKQAADGTISSEVYYIITDKVMEKDLIIRNGSKITGTTAYCGFGASGDIIVEDSTIEMTVTSSVFAAKPTFEGVTVMGGLTADKAMAYNEDKWSMYHYINIVPGAATVLVGDVNADGEVNNLDRVVLTRYLADWAEYSDIDLLAADVNGDGKVNSLDRVILTRHLAAWAGYETLPIANAG